MYPSRAEKMPEQSTERKIHIRVEEGLHRRLRFRCAELDTTIQDFVVKLLDRELSGDEGANRGGTQNEEQNR
jgi:predicted HicB family RNase H-like nuclease